MISEFRIGNNQRAFSKVIKIKTCPSSVLIFVVSKQETVHDHQVKCIEYNSANGTDNGFDSIVIYMTDTTGDLLAYNILWSTQHYT